MRIPPWHQDGVPDVSPGLSKRGLERVPYEDIPTRCHHLILCSKPRTDGFGQWLWLKIDAEAGDYDRAHEVIGWENGVDVLVGHFSTIGLSPNDETPAGQHGKIIWASAAAARMARAGRLDWQRFRRDQLLYGDRPV